jgi:large subunit ribosomal protein L35
VLIFSAISPSLASRQQPLYRRPAFQIVGKTNGPASKGLPWQFDNVAPKATCAGNKETKMPKLKTKSGVKKRFKLTATGKLKHGVAGKRHRLISHNSKYIRQNRGTEVLSSADTPRVKLWAPYGLN